MTSRNALADLAGDWALTDDSGSYACTMAVPGDGITALHKAGLIPDPYWGRNEVGLRWIADRDWTIRRQVHLDRTDVVLVADGLDTICTVRVNGQVVLTTQNAFRTYRAPLTGVARTGVNDFEITFHAATKAANAAQAAQPFFVPYIAANNPIPNGNMLRKPGCDWGWDWNIALAPFGVTGGLWIAPAGVVIDRLAITQEHGRGAVTLRTTGQEPVAGDATLPEMTSQEHGRGAVTLRVTAHLTGAAGLPCQVSFAGQTVANTVADATATATFVVTDPALWWPVGLGAQTLHDLTVTCGGVTDTRRIGLRQLERVTEKDDAGLSFKFRCNGVDVFARGANWIPADALAGRITDAATRDLLQSAVDANMNMIRVWGGGRYEPDSFYDACDELGLMVWQDFMFACNLYPSTPDFLAEVTAEVRENVARLHHHACLALWCGDNELIGALTWFDESRKDRDRYLVSYDRLNRTVEAALKQTDPGANWWPSSPSPGPLSFGDAWHDDSKGDMHFWSVWHEGRDFDHYRDVAPRFCSEFGFQSYPSMDVIKRFADPKDWNIASPVFESHQKNKGGNARIAETMFRYFRWPEKFEDFVWLSQIQQGLAIKTAVTHWRSLKPHCMGTLIWQLNDTWPVCSWSSLDHGGSWKLLHYMARDFYAPVTVVARPAGDRMEFVGISDHPIPVELRFMLNATTPGGQVRHLINKTVTVGATPVVLHSVALADLGADEMFVHASDWRSEMSGDENPPDVTPLRPWKAYDLQPSGATITWNRLLGPGNWQINLTGGSAPAFFATAIADVPGRFAQGALHLFAGVNLTFSFTSDDPDATPTFTLRDLYSATTARPA